MPGDLSARERLIETASALFYSRGVPNVGINELTDRAGVARMTLYNSFGSKEALSLAAFEHQAAHRRALMEEQLAASTSAEDGIRSMFSLSERFATDPDYRGCPFVNVVAQVPEPDGPLHKLVAEHKAWIRQRFHELAEQAGHPDPGLVSLQLLVLLDGASVEAFVQGSPEPIRAAELAAATIISAAS